MPEKRKVVMIEGDGIGPEVCEAVRTVIAATGAPIEWVMAEAGLTCLQRHGTPLPESTLALMREHKIGIKGPTDTPKGEGHRSVNVGLRQELDLYACLRPIRTIPGVHHRFASVYPDGLDIVIVRENTEGLYSGIEAMAGSAEAEALIAFVRERMGRTIPPGSAITLKTISPQASDRIVRFAFEYALRKRRKKVSCFAKANIQKATEGLFLSRFQEIAREFPSIASEDRNIDAGLMWALLAAERFDVIVMENAHGDLSSDAIAALIGGIGMAPGANIGDGIALFEAVHGTAPDIAGQNKANPTALLLSAVMMLEHLAKIDACEHPGLGDWQGYGQQAAFLSEAIERIVKDGEYVTADIWQQDQPRFNEDAQPASTQDMARVIAEEYRAVVDEHMSE